jgi:hypothetical protein
VFPLLALKARNGLPQLSSYRILMARLQRFLNLTLFLGRCPRILHLGPLALGWLFSFQIWTAPKLMLTCPKLTLASS